MGPVEVIYGLLTLGDRLCGKTTLVFRLQGLDISENITSMALDYGLVELKDNDGLERTIK